MSPWGSGQVMAVQLAPRGSGLSSTQASWLCSLPFQGSGLCPSTPPPPVKLPSHTATHVAVPDATRWPRGKEGGGGHRGWPLPPQLGCGPVRVWVPGGPHLPSLPCLTRDPLCVPSSCPRPLSQHHPTAHARRVFRSSTMGLLPLGTGGINGSKPDALSICLTCGLLATIASPDVQVQVPAAPVCPCPVPGDPGLLREGRDTPAPNREDTLVRPCECLCGSWSSGILLPCNEF